MSSCAASTRCTWPRRPNWVPTCARSSPTTPGCRQRQLGCTVAGARGQCCRDRVPQAHQVPAAEPVAARLGSALAELSTLAGWCCYDIGLCRRARWHYRPAMDLAARVGDDHQFADVLQYVGILERVAGHPNDAVNFYQLAGVRLGAKSDLGLVAWGHGLSALPLAYMGHEQATEHLHKARECWQPSNAFERADMHYQTALVQVELGNLDGAERLVAPDQRRGPTTAAGRYLCGKSSGRRSICRPGSREDSPWPRPRSTPLRYCAHNERETDSCR